MYVLMMVLPHFWRSGLFHIITGPKEVSDLERNSMTVQCRYYPGWEANVKWWCRGADWYSCNILVKTDGSEQEAKGGRVSIRDNQRSRTLTVTMKGLRREDTDTYWCGIERAGADLGFPVKVTIAPATATVLTTNPDIYSTTNMFTVPVTPDNTTSSLNVTSHHSDGRGGFMNVCIPLPLVFVGLLLLLVAASLLAWKMVKRQKKAAGISPEQDQIPEALQPPEDQAYYANVPLKLTGAFPRSSGKKVPTQSSSCAQKDQVEVEYISMASFLSKNAAYAALSLDTLDQDSIYINTSDLIAHLPSRSHEELTEYSVITEPYLC